MITLHKRVERDCLAGALETVHGAEAKTRITLAPTGSSSNLEAIQAISNLC